VPTSEIILSWATAVANDWQWLAIAWHVALAALLPVVIARRVSRRLLAFLLLTPVASVALVAARSGNLFNALTFAVIAALLLRAAISLPTGPVTLTSPGWVCAGTALVAFGGVYPHFLQAETWAAYLYASPFGLLPCPTLAVLLGLTLVCDGLRSTRWSAPLSAAGILYGLIGVAILRVWLDAWLLMGALLVAVLSAGRLVSGRVRATAEERRRGLPGDDTIPAAADTLTHAITLAAPPAAVWPWLVQMGAGRAGWYSYDFLDNGRRASARQVVPELQRMEIGTIFPALPGVTEGFIVQAFEPYRSLILAWPDRDGLPSVTWAFVLERRPGNATRLIVRVRAGRDYRFHGLPAWISDPAIRLVHFVMERKQLLGIAERVGALRQSHPLDRPASEQSDRPRSLPRTHLPAVRQADDRRRRPTPIETPLPRGGGRSGPGMGRCERAVRRHCQA